MLDMGFEKDIRALVAAIPAVGRQTLLFTATWPKVVQRVADPRSGVRISLLQPALERRRSQLYSTIFIGIRHEFYVQAPVFTPCSEYTARERAHGLM